MKIIKLTSNDCGGFRPPKGHLDTQMFPECEGTECDRNIVTKTEKERKKKKKKKAISDCEITKSSSLFNFLKHKQKQNPSNGDRWDSWKKWQASSRSYDDNVIFIEEVFDLMRFNPSLILMKNNHFEKAKNTIMDALTNVDMNDQLSVFKAASRIDAALSYSKQASSNTQIKEAKLGKYMQDPNKSPWEKWKNSQRTYNDNLIFLKEMYQLMKVGSHYIIPPYNDYDFARNMITKAFSSVNTKDEYSIETAAHRISSALSMAENIITASNSYRKIKAKKDKKKKKEWDPNPWAVCHTTVDEDKDPEKFERCVKKVKKQQKAFNLMRKIEAQYLQEEMEDVLGDSLEEYEEDFEKTSLSPYTLLAEFKTMDILRAIKALGEESIAGFSDVREDEVREVLEGCQPYELGEIKKWLENTPLIQKKIANNKSIKIAQIDNGIEVLDFNISYSDPLDPDLGLQNTNVQFTAQISFSDPTVYNLNTNIINVQGSMSDSPTHKIINVNKAEDINNKMVQLTPQAEMAMQNSIDLYLTKKEEVF